MIPVNQRVIDAGTGDCMAACLASILEMSLDDVPNPNLHESGNYHLAIEQFLRTQGLVCIKVLSPLEPADDGMRFDFYNAIGAYCVASVPSQRFEGGYHAVVAQVQKVSGYGYGIEIVHDPNPGNAQYPRDVKITTLSFFIPLDYPSYRKSQCAST